MDVFSSLSVEADGVSSSGDGPCKHDNATCGSEFVGIPTGGSGEIDSAVESGLLKDFQADKP